MWAVVVYSIENENRCQALILSLYYKLWRISVWFLFDQTRSTETTLREQVVLILLIHHVHVRACST